MNKAELIAKVADDAEHPAAFLTITRYFADFEGVKNCPVSPVMAFPEESHH